VPQGKTKSTPLEGVDFAAHLSYRFAAQVGATCAACRRAAIWADRYDKWVDIRGVREIKKSRHPATLWNGDTGGAGEAGTFTGTMFEISVVTRMPSGLIPAAVVE
jgi:hypothetical protein